MNGHFDEMFKDMSDLMFSTRIQPRANTSYLSAQSHDLLPAMAYLLFLVQTEEQANLQ